jgi:hypothetical protein
LVGKGKQLGCVLTLGHGGVQGKAGRRRSTCGTAARRPSTRCRGSVATVACGSVAAQGSEASSRHLVSTMSQSSARRVAHTGTTYPKASTTPPGGDSVVRARCSLTATFTDGRGGYGACGARRPRGQGVVDTTSWCGSWSVRAQCRRAAEARHRARNRGTVHRGKRA